jgi:tRNA(His) 5'-end guanylyltransferase
MKEYESNSQFKLIRKLPVIIRIDGRSFRTFTSGLSKPFDPSITMSMIDTTEYLCKNVQNTKLGYTQSDEITLLLTDWDKDNTDSFFGYKLQKLVSVISSMTTMKFNECFVEYQKMYNYTTIKQGNAIFDTRSFNVPLHEVSNVFIWRQQDAIRNSI